MEEVGRERVGDIGIDLAPPARGEQDLSPFLPDFKKISAHILPV